MSLTATLTVLVFICSAQLGSASLLFGGSEDAVNICCYSTNPSEYTPKCYKCLQSIYTNALLACVNATDMPRNISFSAATCMEKNCEIVMPTSAPIMTSRYSDILDAISRLLGNKQKRSVDNNGVESAEVDEDGLKIVKTISIFVQPPTTDQIRIDDDPDYF